MPGYLNFWIANLLWTCRMCPGEMSRLSRRRFVQSMWNSELHRNQVRTSRMFEGLAPPNRPQDTSETYRPPNSFVCSWLIGFYSPPKQGLMQFLETLRLVQCMSGPHQTSDGAPYRVYLPYLLVAHLILPVLSRAPQP